MKVSEAVLNYLKLNGVEYVFGIPSGTSAALYDALNDVDLKTIVTKNEAGAAFMATKYAKVSGKLGVCMVAGGVGASNAFNGIAEAMNLRVPVVLITGYVNTWQIGKGAIQELNLADSFKSITKYSQTVLDKNAVLSSLEEAVMAALTPPQGPVFLSIPLDIQKAEIESAIPEPIQISMPFHCDTVMLERAIELINQERDGLILVGGGCRGLSKVVMQLSEKLNWPLITTPQAKGLIPQEFPLYLGNYGFAGTDAANDYVDNSSTTCLLVLGSSLGEDSSGNFNKNLVRQRKLIHIDQYMEIFNKVFNTDIAVQGHLQIALPLLLDKVLKKESLFARPIVNLPYSNNHTGLSLRSFFEKISEALPQNTHYIADIGEFMAFALKYLAIGQDATFSVHLNYGTMGSGIAGVIGAYLADPDRPVAVFAGDGAFFMNGAEILVAKEYDYPIIYFIINNAMLGLVQNGLQYLYGRCIKGATQERVSITSIMNVVGIRSMAIEKLEDVEKIPEFIKDLKGPCVIEVITDGSEVSPTLERLAALKNS